MHILSGLKVVDVTQFISGSRCTQILADMGAEVVKVEPPGGDTLRMIFKLMPGAERCYSVFNRNKYGIALDWRDSRGGDIVRKLAARSDIFVHNLIPGSLEKSGLGYEDIRKLRPDIIYTAISGFGATGVRPDRAAFDIIAQAVGGQYWNDQETFLLPNNYWGDLTSGAYAAIATLLALIHRMKTGEGQYIDLSMQDVMYFSNYRAMVDKALEPIVGDVAERLGRKPKDVLNSSDRMPFYGFFRSSDGKVAIVALTARQWKDLMTLIGRPEAASDPKFSNIIVQIQHHDEAVAIIEEWTTRHTSREIIAVLEDKKIPCGIAYTIDQVNGDENLRQRDMFMKVSHGEFGEIDVPGFPFKFSGAEGSLRMPAPGLGEHSRMVLEEWLGYSAGEVDALYKEKIIL
ncbi:MAG TPA: CoA transferase [Spirochaetota bacterium]|nr:CoA transferase [Spirochaetota bacterium]HPC42722.1 CoA transferase [Spirochaetota bacterium]HPL16387.1 CoA transferase [Spirochaetota bacterium]HQF08346.1 CoA transferase [Spirochaetota bacterium]HQH98983.1 CoA transferase [Spirochaetota bacterium]